MARLKVLTAAQLHDAELREMMQQTDDEMCGNIEGISHPLCK
jgi:hypothetical protein